MATFLGPDVARFLAESPSNSRLLPPVTSSTLAKKNIIIIILPIIVIINLMDGNVCSRRRQHDWCKRNKRKVDESLSLFGVALHKQR